MAFRWFQTTVDNMFSETLFKDSFQRLFSKTVLSIAFKDSFQRLFLALLLSIVLKDCCQKYYYNTFFLIHFQMFPNGMLEKFRKTVSEDVYYDTLLFEAVIGISVSNYDEAVKYIHQALSHKPYLKSSLKRLVKGNIIYSNKVANRLASDFEIVIRYPEVPFDECFEKDDVDGYIKFSLENDISISLIAIHAILWDAPKILKYIISNNSLKMSDLQKLGNYALGTGNYEIIRILEQCRVNYGSTNVSETADSMNHYEIIEWLALNAGENARQLTFEQSLINNSKTKRYKIALKYDLPNIFIGEFYKKGRNEVLEDLKCFNRKNIILKLKELSLI